MDASAETPLKDVLAYTDALLAIFATIGSIPLGSVEEVQEESLDDAVLNRVVYAVVIFMLISQIQAQTQHLGVMLRHWPRSASMVFILFLLSTSLLPILQIFSATYPESTAGAAAIFLMYGVSTFLMSCILVVSRSLLKKEYEAQFLSVLVDFSILSASSLITAILPLCNVHLTFFLLFLIRSILVKVFEWGGKKVLGMVWGELQASMDAVGKFRAELKGWREAEEVKERLIAYTDGVMGIASTLTLLEIKATVVPMKGVDAFLTWLLTYRVDLIAFSQSFIFIFIIWVQDRILLHSMKAVGRCTLMTHTISLLCISIIPFSSAVMAAFPESPIGFLAFASLLSVTSIARVLILVYLGYAATLPAPLITHPSHNIPFERVTTIPSSSTTMTTTTTPLQDTTPPSTVPSSSTSTSTPQAPILSSLMESGDREEDGGVEEGGADDVVKGMERTRGRRNVLIFRNLIFPVVSAVAIPLVFVDPNIGHYALLAAIPLSMFATAVQNAIVNGVELHPFTRTIACVGPVEAPFKGDVPCACFRCFACTRSMYEYFNR